MIKHIVKLNEGNMEELFIKPSSSNVSYFQLRESETGKQSLENNICKSFWFLFF